MVQIWLMEVPGQACSRAQMFCWLRERGRTVGVIGSKEITTFRVKSKPGRQERARRDRKREDSQISPARSVKIARKRQNKTK